MADNMDTNATATATSTATEATAAEATETTKATETTDHNHDVQQHTHAGDAAQAGEAQAEAGDAEKQGEAAETETQEAQASEPENGEEAKAPEGPDIAALKSQVLDAELRAAAALAGVPANRIPYITRLADKTGMKEGEDAAQYAGEQMKQILKDFPELVQQTAGTGSAGDFARRGAEKDPFLKGLEA